MKPTKGNSGTFLCIRCESNQHFCIGTSTKLRGDGSVIITKKKKNTQGKSKIHASTAMRANLKRKRKQTPIKNCPFRRKEVLARLFAPSPPFNSRSISPVPKSLYLDIFRATCERHPRRAYGVLIGTGSVEAREFRSHKAAVTQRKRGLTTFNWKIATPRRRHEKQHK